LNSHLMNSTPPFQAEIAGVGSYLPEKILTNFDLQDKIDTDDEWIRQRTGIEERRIASKEESSSVLAAHAARKALTSAGIEAGDVDLIIVATSTPDVLFPATACFVQQQLEASRAVAFDITAVCSGFVFALSVAEQYLKTGKFETALVIGSEVNSRIVNWEDRTTCILFGDGAGAMVLKRTQNPERRGVLSTHIHSDGNRSDLIRVPGGIGRTGVNSQAVENGEYFIHMSGNATYKIAVQKLEEVSREALTHNGFSTDDVDVVVPHQANRRIIDAAGERLNIASDKVFSNIYKYGNTSAASIPIALAEAYESGVIKKGNLVLLMVVGSGLTWGAGLIRW
jgi:3-oxoacyl-[acyl-carrier-protein] synthase III